MKLVFNSSMNLHCAKLYRCCLALGAVLSTLFPPHVLYQVLCALVQGTTRLLLTKIPLFQDIIVMSFSCPHCNESNNELQPGCPVEELGVRYSLRVTDCEVCHMLCSVSCSV